RSSDLAGACVLEDTTVYIAGNVLGLVQHFLYKIGVLRDKAFEYRYKSGAKARAAFQRLVKSVYTLGENLVRSVLEGISTLTENVLGAVKWFVTKAQEVGQWILESRSEERRVGKECRSRCWRSAGKTE